MSYNQIIDVSDSMQVLIGNIFNKLNGFIGGSIERNEFFYGRHTYFKGVVTTCIRCFYNFSVNGVGNIPDFKIVATLKLVLSCCSIGKNISEQHLISTHY